MLSLVEKLEDLKAGLDIDTYIDVILQSLPLSYDPFIVNFNMNRLEKSINELINMNKGKAKAKTIVTAKDTKSAPVAPVGIGKGKRKMGTQQRSRANDICSHCHEKGHWKRDCPNLSPKVLQRNRKLSKDEEGYALETVARLSNIAPSKIVAQMPYQIWHGKPASYKVYFYDPSEQKVLITRNAMFLERGFPADTRRDELLLKESSETPQSNARTSSAPIVSTDNVPILHRSTRVPQPPGRYGFLGVTGQLDNDPETYGEAMSDIDSGNYLKTTNYFGFLLNKKGVPPLIKNFDFRAVS
ncbi:hypothetical protein Sango_2097100 [Sesamum angolense]|uniref:CCHC-type domain-containing protein n=1 Tax=Sesamum angolense TaxID=2727404 RepID=A0AAE1WBP2_9LAMI|nr:hypothetical protein Sango_2097100 [Sesamum angolense]